MENDGFAECFAAELVHVRASRHGDGILAFGGRGKLVDGAENRWSVDGAEVWLSACSCRVRVGGFVVQGC